VGPASAVQPLLGRAVDDPTAYLVGQGVGNSGPAAWGLAAAQSSEALVQVSVEPALDRAWGDGQILCDVLVESATLGEADDQEAVFDLRVAFLAEGVVEALGLRRRQADANHGLSAPLLG
jgi:hypothetical protein